MCDDTVRALAGQLTTAEVVALPTRAERPAMRSEPGWAERPCL
jgi:hypothetical protein